MRERKQTQIPAGGRDPSRPPAGRLAACSAEIRLEPQSLSENSEGCCFREKSCLACGAYHRPLRGILPFLGLRPRINDASRLFARKPFGWQVFCLWAALASVVTAHYGIGGATPARSSPPCPHPKSPQRPSQFSVRLLANSGWVRCCSRSWQGRTISGLGKTVASPSVGRCCRNACGAAAPRYQD